MQGVFHQYFQYGFWKVPVMRKHRQVLSARSLAPPAFLASLVILVPGAVFVPVARAALLVELAAYACGALVFGFRSLRKRGEPLRLLPRVVAVYPTFHIAYGLGLVWGLVRSSSRFGETPKTVYPLGGAFGSSTEVEIGFVHGARQNCGRAPRVKGLGCDVEWAFQVGKFPPSEFAGKDAALWPAHPADACRRTPGGRPLDRPRGPVSPQPVRTAM